MSRPDPAGGSLESILASIRKSLAEQSTDALSETPPAASAPDRDAKPARRHGLTQRLAGASSTTSPGAGEARREDDLSDLLETPPAPRTEPVPGVSAPTPTPSGPTDARPAADAPAGNDPLWFLTRREGNISEQTGAQPGPDGPAQPAEPKLTRPEVVRASMPPFFGSSSDGIPPAPAPADAAPAAGARPAPAHVPAPAARAAPDQALAHEVSLVAAAAETAASRPQQSAPPSGLNGRSHPAGEHDNGPLGAGASPRDRALEAMVLDLLKPMLRDWLDQNMPRLVAQALSERAREADGDARKT